MVFCAFFSVRQTPALASYNPSGLQCWSWINPSFTSLTQYLCPLTSPNPVGVQGGTSGYYGYDFNSRIGINIHLADGTYNNEAGILAELQYLQIHHVRDGLSVVPGNTYMINAINDFSSHGIKTHFLTADGMTPSILASDLGYVNAGSYDSLEGPNELNLSDPGWIGKDQTEATSISTYVQNSNPSLYKTGPSLGGFDSYSGLGDLSQYIDYGNTHDYAGGFYPETPGYGGPGYCGYLYGGIDYNLCNAKQASISKPVIATEFGYQINGTVSNDVDASAASTYIIRQIFAHFSHGISKMFIYALYDSGGETFGLLSHYAAGRAGFTELGGFMQIVADSTPVNQTCTVPASVNTTGISSFGICKSDGTYDLVLWQPVTGWDTNAHAYVNVNPINAQIRYSPTFAPTSVTAWSHARYTAWSNSGPISQSSLPVSIPITEIPTVVVFNGPSYPSPLPTAPL